MTNELLSRYGKALNEEPMATVVISAGVLYFAAKPVAVLLLMLSILDGFILIASSILDFLIACRKRKADQREKARKQREAEKLALIEAARPKPRILTRAEIRQVIIDDYTDLIDQIGEMNIDPDSKQALINHKLEEMNAKLGRV